MINIITRRAANLEAFAHDEIFEKLTHYFILDNSGMVRTVKKGVFVYRLILDGVKKCKFRFDPKGRELEIPARMKHIPGFDPSDAHSLKATMPDGTSLLMRKMRNGNFELCIKDETQWLKMEWCVARGKEEVVKKHLDQLADATARHCGGVLPVRPHGI